MSTFPGTFYPGTTYPAWVVPYDTVIVTSPGGARWRLVRDPAVVAAAKATAAALEKSGSAFDKADLAMQSANGKNSLFRSFNEPSGAGTTVADTWYRYAANAQNRYTTVIGEWTWGADGTWQRQQLSHENFSSVDVGTLTVIGESRLADVVAQNIAATTSQFIEADIGKLTVTAGATINSAVITELFSQVVVAETLKVTESFVGTNAILTESITAPKIVVDESLWARLATIVRLEGDELTYNYIRGMEITGSVFQTEFDDNRGVKINKDASNAIEVYDSNGQRTFYADGDTGDVAITGNLQTSPTGERVEISDRMTGTSGIAAVDLFADTTAQHGALYSMVPGGGGAYRTVLAHYTDEFTMAGSLTLFEDGGFQLAGDSTAVAAIWSDGLNNLNVRAADIRFLARTEFSNNMVVDTGWAGEEAFAVFSDANYPDGAVRSKSVYGLTTTAVANTHVDSGGYLRRSTSLQAHKINIDHAWADGESWRAVKGIQSVTYYDKANAERYAALEAGEDVDAEYPVLLLGALAEQVHEAMPVMNTYDDYGHINGVAYERWAAAHQPWLLEHDEQIAALQQEVCALKQRLEIP